MTRGRKGRTRSPQRSRNGPPDKLVSQPLISVVTPFHNTAPYLAQCIESVLAQTYTRFEYILVDNCSTDGSTEIAETYAKRDSRIRLTRRTQLLSQVQNYNAALAEISAESQFCKMVQADDFIFPECLQLMLRVCESSESVGLVSSYWLKGSEIRGSGFPYPTPVVSGEEMARLYLRTGVWVFGSPTAVMYRSSLVREQKPFYDESALHEDTEKCMQILRHWDFGFVHQVLSFSRADNESISSKVQDLQPHALDRYIVVQRYATAFLEAGEAEAVRQTARRIYYRALADAALRFRGRAFWKYQQMGLATLDEKVNWSYLALQVGRQSVRIVASPGRMASRLLRARRRKATSRTAVNSPETPKIG
jgi:glycosyltransferase involved in cell wall biosynthesis